MYKGPWIYVHKPGPSIERTSKGLPAVTKIHDDDVAREMGFKAGIVGGLTLERVIAPAIDATFGHHWYEGGIYRARHKTPTYEGEVRVVWEEVEPGPDDARKIRFWVENREGEQSAPGWAALAQRGKKPVPPWEREAYPPAPTSDVDVLPDMKIGASPRTFAATWTLEESERPVEGMGERNWWHRIASPWGGPIVAGYQMAAVNYKGMNRTPSSTPGVQPARPSRFRTSMDGGHDIVIYRPMFLDQTYRVTTRLCHRWQSTKAVFMVNEYVIETQDGEPVAIVHAHPVHLIKDLQPVPQASGT